MKSYNVLGIVIFLLMITQALALTPQFPSFFDLNPFTGSLQMVSPTTVEDVCLYYDSEGLLIFNASCSGSGAGITMVDSPFLYIISSNTLHYNDTLLNETIDARASPVTTHNLLSGLQGGDSAEYYHLTADEYTELQLGYALDSKVDTLGNWSADKSDYYTSTVSDDRYWNEDGDAGLTGDYTGSYTMNTSGDYCLTNNTCLSSVNTDTTYSVGGTLLDLTGTTFSINEGTLTDEKICTYEATGTELDCTYTDDAGVTSVTGTSPIVSSGGNTPALSIVTTGTWSGNAGTSTALAANPTNCAAGSYPLGVAANGNVESCTVAGGSTDYASIYRTFGSDYSQTMGGGLSYSQIIGFNNNGTYSGAIPDDTNDHITISTAGDYHITSSMSVQSSKATNEFYFIMKNNGATRLSYGFQNFDAIATMQSLNINIIRTLEVGDTVELWFRTFTGGEKLRFSGIELNVIQVG